MAIQGGQALRRIGIARRFAAGFPIGSGGSIVEPAPALLASPYPAGPTTISSMLDTHGGLLA